MMIEDANAGFSEEDLALVTNTVGEDGGDKTDIDPGEKGTETDAKAAPAEKSSEKSADADDKNSPPAENKGTLATGDETPPPKEPKGYWPEGWREKMAEYAAAGDGKEKDRLLRQLGRYVDPAAIFAKTRELESKFSAGGLIKIPGKDATSEEIADFHKALGVPEKADDYIENIHLDNGAVIGDADKPLLDSMLNVAHKAGATQPVVDAVVNWYYATQEEQAADLDESDDTFRRESESALKEEFGPTYRRHVNAIGSLFTGTPGGADINNSNSFYARLMGGRFTDGQVIGNDPDMFRFLSWAVQEINPAATITEDGDQGGKSIDEELKEIQKLHKEDEKKYWSNEVQSRELELIAAKQKLQARA